MGDEEQCLPLAEQRLDASVALFAERLVADREHLVDEQNGLVELRDDREGHAYLHAAREMLVGRVEHVRRLCEIDDRIEPLSELRLGEAVEPRGQLDVVANSEITDETTRDLDERSDSGVHAHGTLVGKQHAGDELQQGRFPLTVAPHDADRFTRSHIEGHIPKCPELSR